MSHHLLVQLLRLGGVTQERYLVKPGSHRPLETAIRISRAKAGKRVQSPLEFLAPIGHSLAKGRELSRHVVRPGGQLQVFVLVGFVGQGKQGGYAFFQNDAKGTVNLQLLDVFGKIPARHPLVGVLVTGLVRELLEPGLDVVLGHFLTVPDGLKIHDSLRFLGSFDVGRRDFHAQLALGFHHGNPELSLHDHFARCGPEVLHCRRRVSLGQNVGNVSRHVIECSKGFEPLANRANDEFRG